MQTSGQRRLIVNADDFGRSSSINEAVIRAHREGILTTASLMVNEPAAEEAVALAKQNPTLGVGLHLTLLQGHSALSHEQIPALVNEKNELCECPVLAGFKYFFQPGVRAQLRKEIQAQLEKFQATGLKLDHVDSHHHLHMHPTVLGIVVDCVQRMGISRVRLTSEPWWLNLRNMRSRRFKNLGTALIYSVLAAPGRRAFRRQAIRHPHYVFGLMQNSRVDEAYLERLLPVLPAGDSEVYSHPSLDGFQHELDALVSPRIRALVQKLGIQLIRYQEL
jgi:hopanoid biosynthesis associated protein HpnK